jgi:glycosyltransferase involved in cell wall biosynthesis
LDRRLIVASIGGWDKPSTAYRMKPLVSGGYQLDVVRTESVPTADQVAKLVGRASKDSVLILRRVLPGRADMRRLRAAFDRIIFDVDDAIYVVAPDLREARALRLAKAGLRLAARGSPSASRRAKPFHATLRYVDVCVVGNWILGEHARRYAPRVVEIPTTTEPIPHPPKQEARKPVIAWLGVAANLQHLEIVAGALQELHRELKVRVRVISSRPANDLGVPTDFVPWSPQAAKEALVTATVGIAPLIDDAWTRGKCAFRAIQYGAHGLPTVASPVGVTPDVVVAGETGYLAVSAQEWVEYLGLLLTDPVRVTAMGTKALERIRLHYSDDVAIERWRELIASL